MLTLADLALMPDERGCLIGQTGCGKSELAGKVILPQARNKGLAILDPKRMFYYERGHEIPIFDNPRDVLRKRPLRFIYRPKPTLFSDLGAYDDVYRYCYNRGDMFVYSDDMVGIMDRSKWPHHLAVCYMMGRAKRVAMLSAFQRPANVPVFLYSEVSNFYVFRLQHGNDVKRVRDMVPGYNLDMLKRKYEFVFHDIHNGNPQTVLLDLKGKTS